jgi:rhodanese-related sulfurtransferase
VEHSSRLSAAELATLRAELADLVVVDVRNPGELERGVVLGSVQRAAGQADGAAW